jgi:predicted ATPase/DNA-binding CsgD family transcriptional regulator/transcriptional regulator with XRE-family HTH domain
VSVTKCSSKHASGEQTSFGPLLKRYRRAAGLSQRALAGRAQLSAREISDLERGIHHAPRNETVQQLSAALGLEPEEHAAFEVAARRQRRAPSGDAVPTVTARPGDSFRRASSLLPAQATPLLGRGEELETIRQWLVGEHVRLLTVTGPAGVGKTRLALEAGAQIADRFPDGVTLVDLAPVRDPNLVLPTLAHRLGIVDKGRRPVLERLAEYLRERTLLLILDNFEQVLPAAGQLVELLATCPGITLLVTSRVPLRLRWEQTLRLRPLAVPDLTALPVRDQLATVPAVALFLARVHRINSDLVLTDDNARVIAALCVRLDGLPLALELAAARTRLLSPQMLLERLEQRFALLRWEAADLPARQHTLGAAIGGSYDLLSAEEQWLFRQLGVFVDGFNLEAAEAIVAQIGAHEIDVLKGLASLVDKSLVQVEGQGAEQVRYTMLESIREYACGQLEEHGEREATERVHATYFLELAERADPRLRMRDQRTWFFRLEQEHDSFRTALRWLLDHHEPQAALHLAGALGFFWMSRGYGAEGWRWLEEALSKAPDADPAIRTRALLQAAGILMWQGDLDRARPVLEDAWGLAQQRRDRSDIAQSLTYLGAHAILAGEWAPGTRLLQEALSHWKDLGDRFYVGSTLFYLGLASLMQGEFASSESLQSEALAQWHAVGEMHTSGFVRFYLALAVRQLGDLPRAVRLVQDGVRVSMTFQDRWHLCLGVNAALLLVSDRTEPQRQARLLGAGDALRQATGFTLRAWERFSDQRLAGLREQLEQEGWGAAYQEGRSRSFEDVATLTLAMLDDFANTLAHPKSPAEPQPHESLLSERELEVLRLVAEGLTSKAIGRHLFLSPSTVNYHLSSIFRKLGAETRAQAVAMAARRGFL